MEWVDYPSPIGRMLLTAEDEHLCGAWFYGQKYFPGDLQGQVKKTVALETAEKWLDAYFAGEIPSPEELPLQPQGSDFRKAVWDILCRIPYGQATTYGEIAAELAERMGLETMSAQAVGGAIGHNPISIIIPCHRVLSASGELTGYAGGLERKRWLLEHEGYWG